MTAIRKELRMENKLRDQVREINEIILSYAQLDFTKRATISGEDDVIDSLAAGINMLGEELQHSAVTLQEKEILLKEIHHRVKNNLQIISSMLHLQAEFSKNRSLKKPLIECQNRIKSMALLHEKLYESEDLVNIEINNYILAISENIHQSIRPEYIEIEFTRSLTNYYSHIDQLLPIGLMINELVTNALEHAFPNHDAGKVIIRLTPAGDQLELEVSDNGIGFELDRSNSEDTLGLQLVEALVEQIDGTWSIVNDSGTVVTVLFSISKTTS